VAEQDPLEHIRNVASRLTQGSGTELSVTALRDVAGGIAAHYGEKGFEQSGSLDEWLDPNRLDPPDELPLAIANDIVLAIDRAVATTPSLDVFDGVGVVRAVIDEEIARRELPA
jgi:hypothetical protein